VHAVQSATLLAASLPQGPLAIVLPGWLDAGADAAAGDGLLRALFAVRLLDQRGGSTPEQRFAWMAGACIGDDVRALARAGLLPPGVRVLVSGPGEIPAAWAHLLRREGCEPVVLDSGTVERAFVTGLWRIASLRHEADVDVVNEQEAGS
jgi:2-keto-3-deoxy-galactonokinase